VRVIEVQEEEENEEMRSCSMARCTSNTEHTYLSQDFVFRGQWLAGEWLDFHAIVRRRG
jgi:hypothetical protein